MKILVTGGAGFIGRRLVRALIDSSHSVRVIDNLTAQVHGENPDPRRILPPEAEFIFGDVRDADALRRALEDVDVVFHFAAQTGVGQSMYQVKEYIDCNVGGTAQLLDILASDRGSVKRIILSSSRAVYGEGKTLCPLCGPVYPELRKEEQLAAGEWEVKCPSCGRTTEPTPTDEDKPLRPGSVYAISKRDQEELVLCVGRAYGIPAVVLRFFNVYGAGQSLINPYTGIISIFASRIKNGEPPLIYEDGLESRDFVHVEDVVQACMLAMTNENADYQIVNVGSGTALSVIDAARIMIRVMGASVEPEVIGKYRVGDIRHCYADLKKARKLLGYKPKVTFEEGIKEFLDWAMKE
ncbi:MAG: NAD-dependent epimerase/dehydratase family protein, partial [Armatimonadota bacterium]|nr:NAD-dependent epimerase/dehydratase family protein [Armatimonadota bacterium]